MSYVIVYDRQVIKTPTGYTFAVLHGDNNLWESNNKKRVRDWNCWLLNKSEAEVKDFFQNWCDNGCNEHFRWGGKFLNDEQLMRWAATGLKNARTIEEILVLRPKQSLLCYLTVWDNSKKYGEPGQRKDELRKRITSTYAFEEWISSAQKRIAQKSDNETIYIYVGFCGDEPLRLGKGKMPEGPVLLKRKNMYIMALNGNGGWKTASSNSANAMVFENAEKAAEVIKRSFDNCDSYKIIRAASHCKKMRGYCIKITDQKSNTIRGYYLRGSKSNIKYVNHISDAKKFTKGEANAAIKRLGNRFLPRLQFDIIENIC